MKSVEGMTCLAESRSPGHLVGTKLREAGVSVCMLLGPGGLDER